MVDELASLQGWTVALFLNGVQLQTVLTDANGAIV